MKKYASVALAFAIVAVPAVALAQAGGGAFGGVDNFIVRITSFINSTLIPLVFALALFVFIWGMFRFFIAGGHDEDAREKGKNLMLYAVLGFVLMVSIFGIVNLISGGINIDDENLDVMPNAPRTNR